MSRNVDFFLALMGEDRWQSMNYPKQILNQRFATVLCNEDLSNFDVHRHKGFRIRPRMPASVKASGTSEVKINDDGFHVSLDLDDFESGELGVSALGGFLEIRGKQEEKRDRYGLVSREFCRQYMVPYNCDIDAITSFLSTDCKLKIKVPVRREEPAVFEGGCVMKLDADKYIEIVNRDLARGGYDQFLAAYDACSTD